MGLAPRTIPPARYRYRAAGTELPLAPDTMTDPRGGDGWIDTAPGGPFHGRTVGWQALTIKDRGVDLECEWDEAVFVDRLVLDAGVLEQVSRIRVFTVVAGRLRQVGQLDLAARTEDEFNLETGNSIGLDLGLVLRRCVIRFETRLTDLVILGGLAVVGTSTPALGIFPTPARSRLADDGPVLADFARVVIRPYGVAGGSASVVADHARGRAAEVLGQTWSLAALESLPSRLDAPGHGCEAILIDLAGRDVAVDEVIARVEAPRTEGFAVVVEQGRVLVVGDRRGLRYGVECILQQLIMDGRVSAGVVVDEPVHAFRAVHLMLPGPSQVEYFRRLVRWLVVPARFNTVIIEVAGGLEFTRHPEINDAWQRTYAAAVAGEVTMPGHFSKVAPGECLPQATMAELVAELRALDLDVVPEVQSLSHVQYLTVAHPEIAEVPDTSGSVEQVDLFQADQPAQHASCYCPSNPASYALVMDVLEEVLEVFRPERYVHLGHDEVYHLGVCPTCRTKDPARLFADDVKRLCAVVTERGLRPIIWSDMLQPDAPYSAAAALDQLPPELIMMDFIWYFHLQQDNESYLLGQGRDVIIGNLYSSHFPRWSQRSRREGILGGQVSTWIPLDDEAMAREGKYFDIAMVGVMLWSDRYHRHHRTSITGRIARLLTDLRGRLSGTTPAALGEGVDLLAGAAEPTPSIGTAPSDPVLAALLARLDGPLTVSEPFGRATVYPVLDPRAIPRSDHAGSPPSALTLAVPPGVQEVHLVHALTRPVPRIAWEPLAEIGRYRFSAADGEQVGVHPITSGGTVGQLHTRYAAPLPTSYYRHQGYTATYRADPISLGQLDDGRDLCLYRTVWRRPEGRPDPAELTVEVDAEVGTALILCAAVAISGAQPAVSDQAG